MNDIARKILFPSVPVDTRVHRAWDIGRGDAVTVTWFCGDKTLLEQTFHSRSLADIASLVKAQPFEPIGNDYVPPGAYQLEWATGSTRAEKMHAAGLHVVMVTPHG